MVREEEERGIVGMTGEGQEKEHRRSDGGMARGGRSTTGGGRGQPETEDRPPVGTKQGSEACGFSVEHSDQLKGDCISVIEDVKGSLFSAPIGAALAHCVSSDLRMGAGIALQFATTWPDIRESGGRNKEPGSVYVFHSERGPVFNLVTKEKYKDKPTMATLIASLTAMREEALFLQIASISVPELGSGLDRLDAGQVRKALNSVFGKSGISIVMYHLSEADRERVIEVEKEARKKKETDKERKHVSFDLKNNETSVIETVFIPGLVIGDGETKSSKKKKKRKKRNGDIGETTEVRTPWVTECDPSKKLQRLKKKLGKLERNEARLEAVEGEADMGKLQRLQRKKELEEDIAILGNRLAQFKC